MLVQPSKLKKASKQIAKVSSDELPVVTLDQAKAFLCSPDVVPSVELLEKLEYYSKAWPATYDGIIEFQRAHKQFQQLNFRNEHRKRWNQLVFEPLIFSTIKRWIYGGSMHPDTMADSARAIESAWVELSSKRASNEELVLRIELALYICKCWRIIVPPAWLRDLKFFTEYGNNGVIQRLRKGTVECIFEAIRTRKYEQAISAYKSELALEPNLDAEEITAALVGFSPDAIKKRRDKANSALGSYWNNIFADFGVMKATAADFILFDIDFVRTKEAINKRKVIVHTKFFSEV